MSSVLFPKVPSRIPLQVPQRSLASYNAPCAGLLPSLPHCFLGNPLPPINRALKFLSQGMLPGTPKVRKPCVGTKLIVGMGAIPKLKFLERREVL